VIFLLRYTQSPRKNGSLTSNGNFTMRNFTLNYEPTVNR